MTTAGPASPASLPRPLRDGIAAGVIVFAVYFVTFAVMLARDSDLEPAHVVIQVAFQVIGIGTLVVAASWLFRRLN